MNAPQPMAEPAAAPALPSVQAVRDGSGGVQLSVGEPHVAIPALLAAASGSELKRLGTRHATLEDVFVSLTGRHLRDE